MKKHNSTKRALLLSVLSMLLCVSMLVGSTFAWFTDSVTSAGNIIKSGTLDVEMYWADGTKAVPVDESGWTDASAGAIFESEKWEPGYTQVRHIQIKNKGTLALKYQIAIEATGEVSDLTDVIDVYYVDPATQVEDRTALTADRKLGTLTEALAGMATSAYGELEAKAAHTVTLALKMQESAGNEYQDKSIGSAFAVKVYATQLNYEPDSFDENYDEGVNYIGGVIYEKVGEKVILKELTDAFTSSVLIVEPGCTDIGRNALAGATIDTVVLPATVKNIEDYAFSQASIPNIVLNEGLESIGNRAFQKNKAMTGIKLPSTLKTIEAYAFQATGLTELVVPASVEKIDQAAFAYNPNLETITIMGNPQIGDGTGETNPGLNFVGRACPKLRSVYIYGQPTYATTGILFSNTEGGIAKDITVYTASVAAADAYKAATAYDDYTLVVMDLANTSADLANMIANADGDETIYMAPGTYSDDIQLTVAALGGAKGDLVFKAAGDGVVFAGTVTLGYRDQGVGATMWNGNVTFEGITFDHKNAASHSLNIQDVESLTLKNCTIIGDGEYGITCARGNATGTSSIIECTFENAGVQLLGNYATGLVIDTCTFNNSCVNVQAGNGVTVQNCTFNSTLTDAHKGDSFYLLRTNSTPLTVKNCTMYIDSTVTGVADSQPKWYLMCNRGTTNWTVEDVAVTLTDAALQQTELVVTATTSTGAINTTNMTVNGVVQ